MYKVIVFAGTTEGYEISRFLGENQIPVLACVATEYGSRSLKKRIYPACAGGTSRSERDERTFFQRKTGTCSGCDTSLRSRSDRNIRKACEEAEVSYTRILRTGSGQQNAVYVKDTQAAAEYLKGTTGNVLLTTGSKELAAFTSVPDYKERLFARVLSLPSVIESCQALGFEGRNLIAMQGPFSMEMNRAMLTQYECRYLVTKGFRQSRRLS